MSNKEMSSLIDRLGQTALECRALIREMHEAERDLKRTIKEAHEAKDQIDKYLASDIETSVKKHIDELGVHTQKAINDTANRILSQFDKLAQPLIESLDDIHDHIDKLRKLV